MRDNHLPPPHQSRVHVMFVTPALGDDGLKPVATEGTWQLPAVGTGFSPSTSERRRAISSHLLSGAKDLRLRMRATAHSPSPTPNQNSSTLTCFSFTSAFFSSARPF